jgi:malate dehydrogenase (oxaloacetate-decarboxylating)(NADP+)
MQPDLQRRQGRARGQEARGLSPTVKTSAPCAPRRWRSTSGWLRPILIGRPAVIAARIEKAGLRMRLGVDVENVNPEDDPRFRQYWEHYHQLMGATAPRPKWPRRRCAAPTPSSARSWCRWVKPTPSSAAWWAATCHAPGAHRQHLGQEGGREQLRRGQRAHDRPAARCSLPTPTSTKTPRRAAGRDCLDGRAGGAALRPAAQGGLPLALQLGSSKRASAKKMRAARDIFVAQHPGIECDGELHGDAALQPEIRTSLPGRFHAQRLGQPADLPQPGLGQHPLQRAQDHHQRRRDGRPGADGVRPPRAYILTPAATVRRVLNMTALAAASSLASAA